MQQGTELMSRTSGRPRSVSQPCGQRFGPHINGPLVEMGTLGTWGVSFVGLLFSNAPKCGSDQGFTGAPSRTRTYNLRIKSPQLCQLSYRGGVHGEYPGEESACRRDS